ncbi:flagellar hook assembly protein FlgD [Saccharophagus sp. K07]|jgi:flagellar basal-body rod modification protein FlgD|uniref:flagellar hook assembly protein FlgD n=1 Tax=Saccharophagus sp. K07 TaxID=2283636 RepID=UPI00165274EB|nr:flagellar hook assembly protein FlgD [Saccharophagus sp. K07]MBC6907400.1 flagellar hook assembly protein FlgD [Saccharophagus sp. K07]
MSDINSISNVLQDYSIEKKAKTDKKDGNELGQKAFLQLMITQLENQDPLSPQENGEFIAQLAQFSSVESLDRLNNNFDSFTKNFVANQALQASSLVGRSVSVETNTSYLMQGSAVTGLVEIPESTDDLKVDIYSNSGELLDTIDIGYVPAGDLAFRWNGQYAEINGKLINWKSSHEGGLPEGSYKFSFTSTVEGKPHQMKSYLSANVNSVTIGSNGALKLNLAGVGAVNLSDVKQFNE